MITSCADSSENENWEFFRQKHSCELRGEDEYPRNPEQNYEVINRQVGAFVVFIYEGSLYPGIIDSFTNDGASVSAMKRALKSWKWPEKKD